MTVKCRNMQHGSFFPPCLSLFLSRVFIFTTIIATNHNYNPKTLPTNMIIFNVTHYFYPPNRLILTVVKSGNRGLQEKESRTTIKGANGRSSSVGRIAVRATVCDCVSAVARREPSSGKEESGAARNLQPTSTMQHEHDWEGEGGYSNFR